MATTKINNVELKFTSGQFTDADIAENAAIQSSKIEQRNLQKHTIPLTKFRVHDAPQTNLPGTAAEDDLALNGTAGSTSLYLTAGDLKAAGLTTRKAWCEFPLPPNYVSGQTVQIRISGGMSTTVADATCTVDVECFETTGAGAIGSDLCTTSAQSINSLTFSDKDFTITASGLEPGDMLSILISIACNDAATGTAVEPRVGEVSILCDTQGG